MARKKVPLQVYIDPRKLELLKILSGKTGVPVAELVRQGLNFLLIREQSAPSPSDTHVRMTVELVLRNDVVREIEAEAERQGRSVAECVESIVSLEVKRRLMNRSLRENR